MEKETVQFEVTLSGTYWDKIPEFSIMIDEHEFIRDYASDSKTFTFETELSEGEHTFKINLLNKSNNDTIQNEDKTEILKDMLLNIEHISIDDIEIENLKWSASEYLPEDSKREIITNCVNLGWNGSYQIKFESPVYLWLLENL